jgi:hypothetical protein
LNVNFIKRHFRNRRMKRLFGNYVDPKLLDQLLDDRAPLPAPINCEALLLLIETRFTPVETLHARGARVVQAVRAAGGMLESFMSTMILAVFPTPLNRGESVPDAGRVTTAIMEALGSDVHLVWLRTSALCGCIETEYTHFGTVSPDVLPAMQLLSTLEYGESRQFERTTSA